MAGIHLKLSLAPSAARSCAALRGTGQSPQMFSLQEILLEVLKVFTLDLAFASPRRSGLHQVCKTELSK